MSLIDLAFALASVASRPDGTIRVEARGMLEGTAVGFAVELGGEWKKTIFGRSELAFYAGTATLRSIGAESDAFVRALDALYGTARFPKAMRAEVRLVVVSMLVDPKELLGRRIELKTCFVASDTRPEIFINVDAPAKLVELFEKDVDNRRAIVDALSV